MLQSALESIRCKKALLTAAMFAVVAGTWWSQTRAQQSNAIDQKAVERTRKQVQMLDDIYKTAVVLITEKYVHDENSFAAGAAAVALFDAVKKKGWHEARLLDATGKPYDAENSPKDGFEKDAIAALKSGKNYFEKITTVNGKPTLLAATAIPVVHKKCAMCHPHYAQAKPGEAIGAIGYTLTIE